MHAATVAEIYIFGGQLWVKAEKDLKGILTSNFCHDPNLPNVGNYC